MEDLSSTDIKVCEVNVGAGFTPPGIRDVEFIPPEVCPECGSSEYERDGDWRRCKRCSSTYKV